MLHATEADFEHLSFLKQHTYTYVVNISNISFLVGDQLNCRDAQKDGYNMQCNVLFSTNDVRPKGRYQLLSGGVILNIEHARVDCV